LPVDVQEEFGHLDSVVRECLLEGVDLIVCAAPLLLAGEPLHALHQDSSVPTAVEHGELAFFRSSIPKPPKVMLARLLIPRGSDRPDFVASRIQLHCQPFDHATLDGSIPTLEATCGSTPVAHCIGWHG